MTFQHLYYINCTMIIFCHVFHQDYIVRKGNDPFALEHRM